MADNVAVTAGSGTSIATDDVGGAHYQRVKLDLGGDGLADPAVGSVPVDDNGSTLSVDDGGGSLTVDGPLTDAQLRASAVPISAATLPLPTGAATAANQATTNGHLDGVEALLTTIDADTGTLAGAVSGAEMQVDVVGALPAGTNNIGDVDVASLPTGASAGQVQGTVAHDSADAQSPVKVGAKATTGLHGVTLVADADRTDLYAGVDGALIVRQDAGLESLVSGNASNTDGTSTQVIAAAGAGVKVYMTDVTLTNTSAADVYVELKDGATAKWTFPVPAGGGVTHSFRSPLAGTANTAWNFDPSAAASTVYCSASGFKSKV